MSLKPYLWTFAVFVIPNLLFTGAVLALLAVTTRNILWVYIGVLGFIVLYGVSASLTKDLDNVWLATLVEPLGQRALGRTMRYWSAEERNTGLPAIAGYILANRALWMAIALALFAATFALFRTERSGTGASFRAQGQGGGSGRDAARAGAVVAMPRITPEFSPSTAWRQFLRQLRFDSVGVVRSVPFLVMLAFGVANFIATALNTQVLYDTRIYPVTSQMLSALQGSMSLFLVIIVAVLRGRTRVQGTRGADQRSQRRDAGANWVPLAAKFATLVVVILAFLAVGALASIAIQLGKGYTQVEPMVYVETLLLQSVGFILMGGLALCLQVFTNNKFIGYALLILVLVLQAVLGTLDYTHNLYNFDGWPAAPYSDMNGFGHFLVPQLWFKAYWGLFVLALLLLASALWVRGTGDSAKQRWALAKQRLHGRLGVALAASVLAFVAVGGFLFWNTNIRNDYLSPDGELDLQARYETRVPQVQGPAATQGARGRDRRRPASGNAVDARPWRLSRAQPVSSADPGHPHPDGRRQDAAAIDMGGAKLTLHDEPIGYRIYHLDQPLQPGEQRDIRFDLDFHPHGIGNDTAQHQIVGNGSFVNSQMFPTFGYNEGGQIQDRNERRKRGLGEPTRMPKLEDQAARANTYLTDDADWIDFKATVCTAPDQIALAPGYLQKESPRDGRRCFSYAMDRPMLDFYGVPVGALGW